MENRRFIFENTIHGWYKLETRKGKRNEDTLGRWDRQISEERGSI